MASRAFPNEDIEILTNNIMRIRNGIIQELYDEHVEIDPELIYSNCRNQLRSHSSDDAGASAEVRSGSGRIGVDYFKEIYDAMDEVDKRVPDLPKNESKESKGLRRYNSRSDIVDRTMLSSMSNLTMIKKIMMPAPVPQPHIETEPSIKLTTNHLIEFNALKQELKSQLDACKLTGHDEDPFGFAETGKKITATLERLQTFFDEIIPLQNGMRITTQVDSNDHAEVWNIIDAEWMQSLHKLSEVNCH